MHRIATMNRNHWLRRFFVWSALLVCGGWLGWFLASYKGQITAPTLTTEVSATDRNRSGHRSVVKLPKDDGPTLVDVEHLLRKRKYEALSDRYANLASGQDEAASKRVKGLLLEHVSELVLLGSYTQAQRLLVLMLEHNPKDVDLLLAVGQTYRLQKNYQAALASLYDARAYAYRIEVLEEIENQIRSVVALYTKYLIEQENQDQLLRLYEKLVGIEPTYAPYYLRLAETQLGLGHREAAAQSLQVIRYDPSLGAKATQLLQRLEQGISKTSHTGTAVPLRRVGEHYLLSVLVNDAHPVTLLIDTGASLTVMRPNTLRAVGVEPESSDTSRRLYTANGVTWAPIVTLASLAVGDQIMDRIEVAAMELPGMHDIDGLLGMNFLRNFRFFIDQTESVLLLSSPVDLLE